jgi:hypothetical protein
VVAVHVPDVLPDGVTLADAGAWPRLREAAKAAGLSVRSLQRRIGSGALRAYSVFGVIRLNPADLAAGVSVVVPRRGKQGRTSAGARKAAEKFFRR